MTPIYEAEYSSFNDRTTNIWLIILLLVCTGFGGTYFFGTKPFWGVISTGLVVSGLYFWSYIVIGRHPSKVEIYGDRIVALRHDRRELMFEDIAFVKGLSQEGGTMIMITKKDESIHWLPPVDNDESLLKAINQQWDRFRYGDPPPPPEKPKPERPKLY